MILTDSGELVSSFECPNCHNFFGCQHRVGLDVKTLRMRDNGLSAKCILCGELVEIKDCVESN